MSATASGRASGGGGSRVIPAEPSKPDFGSRKSEVALVILTVVTVGLAVVVCVAAAGHYRVNPVVAAAVGFVAVLLAAALTAGVAALFNPGRGDAEQVVIRQW